MVRIARSAGDLPRNSQMSPVAAVAMASAKGRALSCTGRNLRN
jgi:hypothetical protein